MLRHWYQHGMDLNETPNEPHHLGVPSASSKMISKPRVCFAKPWPYLATTLTPSPNGAKQDSPWPTFHQARPKWILSPWYIRCKPCTYLAARLTLLQMEWNELPLEPRNIGVPSGASKTNSEPMVRLAQTIHLYCSNPNTVSECAETRFDISHVS
jgi:hypothetical protein